MAGHGVGLRGLSVVVRPLAGCPGFPTSSDQSLTCACLILHPFKTNRVCVCVLIIALLGCLAIENVSTTFCEPLGHRNSVLDSWEKEIQSDRSPPLCRK